MKQPSRLLATLTVSIALLISANACLFRSGPPERDFDQSEAYQIIEDAFRENLEHMEDFPGFEMRQYSSSACEHSNGDETGFIRMEITYVFSSEDSDSDLVREDYFQALKEAWDEADYDVHGNDVSSGGERKNLEARRTDGINYWYRVWDRVALTIQSGCVQQTDIDEPYIPPIEDVSPRDDQMHKFKNSNNDNESEEAINPFAN